MTNRRQSREAALQVLFQHHFTPEINVSDSLALFESHFLKNQDSWNYAKVLTLGVLENKKQIDENLQSKSRNWKLDRMAGVDVQHLMRIARPMPPRSHAAELEPVVRPIAVAVHRTVQHHSW